MSDQKKIAVFGVGNSLMGDDGVAEAVLNELQERDLPEAVRLINVAGDPLRIAQEMPGLDGGIVIDAADMGLEPGEIRSFEVDEASYSQRQKLLSNHGLGLGQVLKIIQTMGLAEKIRLIGIQPYKIDKTVSSAMSPEMRNRVEKIADLVIEIILNY